MAKAKSKWVAAVGSTPKYKQIIRNVQLQIKEGLLKKGDRLPSVNTILKKNEISRDTLVKAFDKLKQMGIIKSFHGKGNYIASESVDEKYGVLLFMDDMNMYKNRIYNAVMAELQDEYKIDLFFHHNNPEIFASILRDKGDEYKYLLVIALDDLDLTRELLVAFKGNIILVDRDIPGSEWPAVYQEFMNGIYASLLSGYDAISKYDKINLIIPKVTVTNFILADIKKGVQKFSREKGIKCQISDKLSLRRGELYFVLDDDPLVALIKAAKKAGFKAGRDFGIISHNETPFKEILEDGISVVSTDFYQIGVDVAGLVKDYKPRKKIAATTLIKRNSI